MTIYMLLVEAMINTGWSKGQMENIWPFPKRLSIGVICDDLFE